MPRIPTAPTAPVDTEAVRLMALVQTVFEERHYSPDCNCSDCQEVRQFMTPADRDFVDTVARFVRSSDPNPAEAEPAVA